MAVLYGVDSEKEVTPLMVRDAMSQCFYEAHCEASGVASDDEELNKSYCKETVRKAFADADADFEHPTRDGIIAAAKKLAEFSKNFRDQSIVQKHFGEMMVLVNALK